MRILRSYSEAEANLENAKAQAYLDATVEDYNATRWSDVFVSPDGKEYGISWEDRIEKAFTDEELGKEVKPGPVFPIITYSNVIEVDGWSVVEKPVEE